ncbi:MAG: DUF58 domain-containing protein [Verrucomicrobiales bacterium]
MRPSTRFVTAVLAWTGFGAVAGLSPGILGAVWWAIGGALGMAASIDAIRLRQLPAPTATRQLPDRFAQRARRLVRLTLRQDGRQPLHVTLSDDVPPTAGAVGLPWSTLLPPGQRLTLDYPVTPSQRGPLTFGPLTLRWESPWRLWSRYAASGEPTTRRVYPNYEPIVREALLALAHRESIDGLQQRRRSGASRDFHQLRDFQEGDSLAAVDWRATSRRLALISREYREERNQCVILAIDCGRRLRAIEDGLPQFDHALNALLLLAYVALRQGDQVGMLGLGAATQWFAPRRGPHVITPLLEHLAGYEPSDHSTDFAQAAALLQARQKQRALIVIVTNLRNEDTADLLPALHLLRQRHLIVIASLQDLALTSALTTPPHDWDSSLATATAHFQRHERALALATLRAAHIDVLDTSATQLPLALAQHYLDIKHRGRL